MTTADAAHRTGPGTPPAPCRPRLSGAVDGPRRCRSGGCMRAARRS
ncbi:hypothetical protein [Kitasatospora sp. NPDC088134]